MLDLKALEQELDTVLAKETPESLLEWLFNRRIKNFLSSIDKEESIFWGDIMNIHTRNSVKYCSEEVNSHYDGDYCLNNAA